MLQFILGAIVGGIISFLVFAVLSVNASETDEDLPTPKGTEKGDSDAGNQ